MQFIADTHTHTIMSGHAYSTLSENMAAAAQAGLRFLCSTEHASLMPDAPHFLYFDGMRILPDSLSGVYLIRGCEVDIVDVKGTLDLPENTLKKLEWVIASLHPPVYRPAGVEAHTETWLQIARNPLVDVIGHCGDGRYRFDYETVIREFARNGKIVEINANSFRVREGSQENCRVIAQLCKKHGVRIVVSSDAHHCSWIGNFGPVPQMLQEIGFPEEQILNANYERFAATLEKKTGRSFPVING
ncbi:MAG: phosphatase [Provencibacterium sp.]|jgi:putative hydrolase|nr:phosphatase [Provencibacterium sp.]